MFKNKSRKTKQTFWRGGWRTWAPFEVIKSSRIRASISSPDKLVSPPTGRPPTPTSQPAARTLGGRFQFNSPIVLWHHLDTCKHTEFLNTLAKIHQQVVSQWLSVVIPSLTPWTMLPPTLYPPQWITGPTAAAAACEPARLPWQWGMGSIAIKQPVSSLKPTMLK